MTSTANNKIKEIIYKEQLKFNFVYILILTFVNLNHLYKHAGLFGLILYYIYIYIHLFSYNLGTRR
jgi:Ca2+/Na+ antiporter